MRIVPKRNIGGLGCMLGACWLPEPPMLLSKKSGSSKKHFRVFVACCSLLQVTQCFPDDHIQNSGNVESSGAKQGRASTVVPVRLESS